MAWLRVTLKAEPGLAEKISAGFEDLGAIAVTLSGDPDTPIFDEPEVEPASWTTVTVSGMFEDSVNVEDLLQTLTKRNDLKDLPTHHIESLADEDWERVWMDRYQPIHIGGRLWICPSWQTPPQPDAINVVLDPGLAFGSGTHPTTQLCLSWLANRSLTDKTLLDYGCGSGVLAIAALKLGCQQAWGVDVDAQALVASRDNAQANQVADRLDLCHPDKLDPALKVDVVVANILAQTLISLASNLIARVSPGGTLLLSGILNDQAEQVAARFDHSFNIQRRQQEDWSLLVATPKTGKIEEN
ncbi:MAG TPA: 50S ribosomal protein L11 methyltransferase [Acidiferrobacteraceae bacterium]|nr:50S ribosomal protein L11 methyltransferase [Acidiferrobacteraceae bacterium]